LSLCALAVASTLPIAAFTEARDGTPVLLSCIALGVFAAHARPGMAVIGALAGVDLALVVLAALHWPRSAGDLAGDGAAMLVVTLFGLIRRQFFLQSRQTRQLLEQTRLAQREQARAAAADERARIAREMHDVLAHSLGALGVQLEVAETLLAERGDVAAALERVRRSRSLARDGLREAREAVAALRTDPAPLAEALADLAVRFRLDHHAEVELRTEGSPRTLSAVATVSLLRTAREALTNAARHALGRPVTILLDFRATSVALRIRNDLPAEPSEQAGPGSGHGLVGMTERIALVGGTLVAGAADGSCEVSAEVPE
jgi:signal transduction histidine kinase